MASQPHPGTLDSRSLSSSLTLGVIVALVVVGLAQLYTFLLFKQISDVISADPKIVQTLELRDLASRPIPDSDDALFEYWSSDSKVLGVAPFTHLDRYVRTALTINSEIRSKGDVTGASSKPIDVWSISALFGFEQYVCFFLAGFCWAELRSLKRRIVWEEDLSIESESFYIDEGSGSEKLTGSTAASAHSKFVTAIHTKVYGEKLGSKGEDLVNLLRKFYWVDAVISCSREFTRTDDRTSALKDGESALEAGREKFEGGFHIEQYLQWAIPGIGFIGTIRGISGAMGAAEVADDLPIVVAHLGIAFNSTLTALLISLVLMAKRHAVLNKGEEVFAELKQRLRKQIYGQYKSNVSS